MNVPAIEDLCNGSTPDSDSVCGGSNPSSSAIKTRYPFGYLVFVFCWDMDSNPFKYDVTERNLDSIESLIHLPKIAFPCGLCYDGKNHRKEKNNGKMA